MALQLNTGNRKRETILGPRSNQPKLRDGFGCLSFLDGGKTSHELQLEATVDEQQLLISELRAEIVKLEASEQEFEKQLEQYQDTEYSSCRRRKQSVHSKLKKALNSFLRDESKVVRRRALVLSVYIDSFEEVEGNNLMRIRKQRVSTSTSEEVDLKHMQMNIISQVLGLMWLKQEECSVQLVEYLSSNDFFEQYFLKRLDDDDEYQEQKSRILAIDRNLRERQAELLDLELKEKEAERAKKMSRELDEMRYLYESFKAQQEQATTGGRSERIPDDILKLTAEPPDFEKIMRAVTKPTNILRVVGFGSM